MNTLFDLESQFIRRTADLSALALLSLDNVVVTALRKHVDALRDLVTEAEAATAPVQEV